MPLCMNSLCVFDTVSRIGKRKRNERVKNKASCLLPDLISVLAHLGILFERIVLRAKLWLLYNLISCHGTHRDGKRATIIPCSRGSWKSSYKYHATVTGLIYNIIGNLQMLRAIM